MTSGFLIGDNKNRGQRPIFSYEFVEQNRALSPIFVVSYLKAVNKPSFVIPFQGRWPFD